MQLLQTCMLVVLNCNRHDRWSIVTIFYKAAECNSNKHACWLRTKLKTWVLQQACLAREAVTNTNCLVSDICAGSVPQNQTCVMVNMSADPVATMAGLLV